MAKCSGLFHCFKPRSKNIFPGLGFFVLFLMLADVLNSAEGDGQTLLRASFHARAGMLSRACLAGSGAQLAMKKWREHC